MLFSSAKVENVPDQESIAESKGTDTWAEGHNISVLLSPDKARALNDFRIFKKTCQKAGLTVSMKKTKYLNMPNKLPEEKTTTPVVAPLRRVPEGATNAGAIYYVMRRNQRACPIPGCAHRCNQARDTFLRAHFKQTHNLTVNVLKAAPRRVPVYRPVIGPECPYCHRGFTSTKTAKAHIKKSCKSVEGNLSYMYIGGNKKPLVQHETSYDAMREEWKACDMEVAPVQPAASK